MSLGDRRTSGRAFGVTFQLGFEARGLPIALEPERTPSVGVRLELAPRSDLEGAWTGHETRICDQRDTDGSLFMAMDFNPDAGYLLFGRGYGLFLVSADGAFVRCAPDPVSQWRWQAFLHGQVLPLVSLLHGFEPVHASAVSISGKVVALSGPSYAGKTSVALHLVKRGAMFVADDVVALEVRAGRVLAHGGAAVAKARSPEAKMFTGSRVGEIIGTHRSTATVLLDRDPGPLPVGAFYLLSRQLPAGSEIEFSSLADPRFLLASTFNFALRRAQIAVTQLDVCASLAGSRRVFTVSVPLDAHPSSVAAAVDDHLEHLADDEDRVSALV